MTPAGEKFPSVSDRLRVLGNAALVVRTRNAKLKRRVFRAATSQRAFERFNKQHVLHSDQRLVERWRAPAVAKSAMLAGPKIEIG